MTSRRNQQSVAPPKIGKCPICREPSIAAYRPFCSRRCADIDLGRWLGGGYVIAGGNADADEDGEEALPLAAEENTLSDK
ncbi:MAG TPA: DNA gyrase inhibitor YacG [Hyphomicrobium sp.]|nr:DNA gyrase inhibitor YacG [Hyphomicrobium sp.]